VPDQNTCVFLDAAIGTLSQLPEDQRKILRVLIDMLLIACEPDLETSIAMASSALELASEEWLPSSSNEHHVAKAARHAIRQALIDSANMHAPRTEFAADAVNIARFMFKRSAKTRFGALLTHLGIAADDDGIAQFVNMRNKVVHGGFQKRPLEDRIRALLFGRWMLASCITRYLGYKGPTRDWRKLKVR
jgi:hypothetical protein